MPYTDFDLEQVRHQFALTIQTIAHDSGDSRWRFLTPLPDGRVAIKQAGGGVRNDMGDSAAPLKTALDS